EIASGCRIFGHVEAGEGGRLHSKAARSQRMVLECLAERVGSLLDATLQMRDASGKQLAFSHHPLWPDPILGFPVTEVAEYTAEVWDFPCRGKYSSLLVFSSSPRALSAFPLALSDQGADVTFYGWNLPGSAGVSGLREPLEALSVHVSAPNSPLQDP